MVKLRKTDQTKNFDADKVTSCMEVVPDAPDKQGPGKNGRTVEGRSRG
jgi:hypothetical protein